MKREDKLKQFVSEKRAAFDHRIPDLAVRERIWQQMKTEQEKPVVKSLSPVTPLSSDMPSSSDGSRYSRRLWSVAASVAALLVIGTVASFWLMNGTGGNIPENREFVGPAVEQQRDPVAAGPEQDVGTAGLDPLAAGPGPVTTRPEQQPIITERHLAAAGPDRPVDQHPDNRENPGFNNPGLNTLIDQETLSEQKNQAVLETRIAALLETEESASRRMEGILEMASLPELPQKLMDKLMHTINHDPNSNVRYAAIELLMTRLPAMQTGQAIQDVFIKQDDPTIQLDLMLAMAQHDTIRINDATADRLYAIANDPLALDFVKNQAYAVLLKTW